MENKFTSVFCLFIAACFSLTAHAQDSLQKHQNILNIALGGDLSAAKFYNNNLTNSFKEQNLPVALNKMPFYYKFNIFFYSLTPQTKLTYHISAGFADQSSSEGNIKLDAKATTNDYTIDYIAWQHKGRQYFFPGLGWGFMTYNYRFTDQSAYPSSYSEALQSFNGERTVQSGNLTYLNVEANYAYALDKTDNLLLGVHAEYHIGLNSKTMQLTDGYNLPQSPAIKANSFIMGVSIIVQ